VAESKREISTVARVALLQLMGALLAIVFFVTTARIASEVRWQSQGYSSAYVFSFVRYLTDGAWLWLFGAFAVIGHVLPVIAWFRRWIDNPIMAQLVATRFSVAGWMAIWICVASELLLRRY
jgi:hypothetical protein